MTVKHERLNLLARYLHRCPTCKAWFSLNVTRQEAGGMGLQTDFICDKCQEECHDWKPSSGVKF